MIRGTVNIEDYEALAGAEAIERIKEKARLLRGLHVTNINSTYYGGGVAQLLSSLTLLMNSVGIKTGWRAIPVPFLRRGGNFPDISCQMFVRTNRSG